MKKILCLIDSLGAGGAQRQLAGLASFLVKKDYDVIVATYHDDCFYVDQLQANEVSYIYLKKANNSFLRIWHVARYIRRTKPDVVLSYLETPSICACIAKVFNSSFKLIVSERNTTQHTGCNEKIRFNLFRVSDYVVPNAYAQEDYIKNTFPCLASKVVTIPNFVDLNFFVSPKIRHRRDTPEIMVAASIWASKNTLGFVDAVAKLREKGRKFHISWYGLIAVHTDYINQCRKKIEQSGLNDIIELKEKTSQIKECYQEADFFCLPSFYEGTPNVICEAAACGLPIACSDVCDNGRYVIDGENGFLFNPNNVESICLAFEKLLFLSDQEYACFCKNSRSLVEQKCSKEKFIQSYIKLIES